MDADSALRLYRLARDAAPGSFRVHLRLHQLLAARATTTERRREYAEFARSGDPLFRCLARVAGTAGGSGSSARLAFDSIVARWGHNVCTLAAIGGSIIVQPDSLARGDSLLREAQRAVPTLGSLWLARAGGFEAAAQPRIAEAVLREGLALVDHPLERLSLGFTLQRLVFARDTAAGNALLAELARGAARDGRPGVRFQLFQHLWSARPADAPRIVDSAVAIARAHGQLATAAYTLVFFGARQLDAGHPSDAVRLMSEGARLADSARVRPAMLQARLRLGRAFMKTTRWTDALRELLRARALADSAEPYIVADIEHNLAHVYEGMGDLPRAAAAADRFAAEAEALQGQAIRIMAFRDAGQIHSRAGNPAAARRAFVKMVRFVEEQRANWIWAGEYFERAGDLRRALGYYQRVPASDAGEGARALAGVTRIYEAMGLSDSAEAAARAHDAATQTPEEVLLLPRALVRSQRAPEGLRIARSWRDRWRSSGNVAGDAIATLELGHLLLDAGLHSEALREGEDAVRLSERAALTDERVASLVLRGRAELAGGRAGIAARTLREAVARSARASPRIVADAHGALGVALAAFGGDSLGAAMASFDRAARTVEGLITRFDDDADRARFRDAQHEVFDDAIRALLAEPRPDPAAILTWDRRRKVAALGGPGTGSPAMSLADLQRALRSNEALVDYVLLDSSASAVVVTRRAARVVPIRGSAPEVGAMVERLREPFTEIAGGRVDLAHARYDLRLAERLYGILMAPVLRAAPEATRLVVVPDGALRLLSFDALVAQASGSYAGSTYLMDTHTLSVAPVPAVPAAESRLRRGASLLVVRGDVPGGSEEQQGVRAAWRGGPVESISGSGATRAAVAGRAGDHDVLHFAVHATASTASSILRLADGGLDTDEIGRLALRAKLVVLSACETEAGPVLRGTGPLSLARSFLAAGADAVVATTWPVSGHAAEVMTRFYENLAAGRDGPDALRLARLPLRRSEATSHPFFWAGYTHIRRR